MLNSQLCVTDTNGGDSRVLRERIVEKKHQWKVPKKRKRRPGNIQRQNLYKLVYDLVVNGRVCWRLSEYKITLYITTQL